MILSHLRTAVLAAFPGLDAPKKAFFRVVRSAGLRLSVQPVNAKSDQTTDVSNLEVWPGVPGVSSDPTPGEQVVVSFVGQDQTPIVTHRGPPTPPNSTELGVVPSCPLPVEVRHDVTAALRMLSRSETAAKMYVGGNGSPTYSLARNIDLVALFNALDGAATTMSASGVPEVVAVGDIITTALGAVNIQGTTKLESQ